MTSVRFGIAIPQTYGNPRKSIAELRRFVERAEELGVDSVWVQEQLMGHDQSFEPLVTLAFAAAHTERVRLCSATFIAPVRNPIVFAKQLASVDQFSNGRLTVGISVGDMRTLYPASGVDVSTRGRRMEETVEVMRRLWTEDIITFHGRFFDLDGVSMEPKPVQKPHPPIWFGGHTPAVLDRTVRLGSGWVGAGGRSISQFGASVRELRTLLDVAGRVDFSFVKKLYTAVGGSREEAFGKLSRWFDVHWGSLADGGRLAERVGVYGTPDSVLQQAIEAWRLGADEIIFNPVLEEREHLEVIAAEVVPALREATSGTRPGSEAVRIEP